jgi:hypothetical protein
LRRRQTNADKDEEEEERRRRCFFTEIANFSQDITSAGPLLLDGAIITMKDRQM